MIEITSMILACVLCMYNLEVKFWIRAVEQTPTDNLFYLGRGQNILFKINLGHYTSFVQMRGSVPAQWAQDLSKIQPKPPIFIETEVSTVSTVGPWFQ